MTDRELMQQALEALEYHTDQTRPIQKTEAIILALRERLARQEQEPVAWPAGLIDRIKAAEQRIRDGHAPRRIPADPTDVDLVLAEVRYLLEGKQPPFWVYTAPPPAQQPLTDEQISAIDWKQNETLHDFARAIEAAHGITGEKK